jgi:hypothetical protein
MPMSVKKEPFYSSSHKSFSVWIDFRFIISHFWHFSLPLQLLSFPLSPLLWPSKGTLHCSFIGLFIHPSIFSFPFGLLPSFDYERQACHFTYTARYILTSITSSPKKGKHWQHSQLPHATLIRNSFNSISVITIIIYICHGFGPLVDPFRSHVSRSLFKGLPWFLLPVGE